MRRFGVLLSMFAALGLVWAGAAAADHPSAANNPPGCNGTIFLSDSTGGDRGTDPQYTQGETVFVFGDQFDADDTAFDFQVITEPPSPQQGTVVASGSLDGDGSGHIPAQAVYDTSDATDEGPYKVLVSWTDQGDNPEECSKSKNFRIQLAAAEEEEEEQEEQGEGVLGEEAGGGEAGAGVAGAQAAGELPFTGLPVVLLIVAGVSLLGGGLVLRRMTR